MSRPLQQRLDNDENCLSTIIHDNPSNDGQSEKDGETAASNMDGFWSFVMAVMALSWETFGTVKRRKNVQTPHVGGQGVKCTKTVTSATGADTLAVVCSLASDLIP
jgi:hypothetical protein